MGLEVATLVAIGGAVAAAGGTAASIVAGNQQRAAARHAADLQQQAQEQQIADNTAKAAAERRQQVRDERIRQARIAQSSVNTGTEGSSGELGAISSVSTQTQSNVGFNLGQLAGAGRITELNQQAATSIFEGQQSASTALTVGSIFGAAAQGANSFASATRTVKPVPTDAYGNPLTQ